MDLNKPLKKHPKRLRRTHCGPCPFIPNPTGKRRNGLFGGGSHQTWEKCISLLKSTGSHQWRSLEVCSVQTLTVNIYVCVRIYMLYLATCTYALLCTVCLALILSWLPDHAECHVQRAQYVAFSLVSLCLESFLTNEKQIFCVIKSDVENGRYKIHLSVSTQFRENLRPVARSFLSECCCPGEATFTLTKTDLTPVEAPWGPTAPDPAHSVVGDLGLSLNACVAVTLRDTEEEPLRI